MNINYLLPNKFKSLGISLLIPSLIIGFLFIFYDYKFEFLTINFPALLASNPLNENENMGWISDNFTDEIAGIGFLLGLLFLAFSKEKFEDEYIAKIRLESLVWAIYFNSFILIISFLFVFNFSFLQVMIYNLFTPLIFFNLRYYGKLFILKKQLNNEE